MKGHRPHIPSDMIEPWLSAIITSCWSQDPKRRPSFERICQVFDENIKMPSEAVHSKVNHTNEVKESFKGNAFLTLNKASIAKRSRSRASSHRRTTLVPTIQVRRKESFAQSSSLKHFLLLSKILGYSAILSIFIISLIAVWSHSVILTTNTFKTVDGFIVNDFPVLDTSRDFQNFVVVAIVLYGLASVGNVGKSDVRVFPNGGPKYVIATIALTVILPCAFYAVHHFGLAHLDNRYSLANVIMIFVFPILFIPLDIKLRSRWERADSSAVAPGNIHSFKKETRSGDDTNEKYRSASLQERMEIEIRHRALERERSKKRIPYFFKLPSFLLDS